MTEHEPSYYEIALTNRQVLVGFVFVLVCVLAAFLSGVWLGRRGPEPVEVRAEVAENGDLAALEDLSFFDGDGPDPEAATVDPEDAAPAAELRRPDLSQLLEEPQRDTTLAQDVGSAPPPSAPEAGRPSSPPPPPSPTPSPPPPTPPPPSPPPPSAPTPTASNPSGTFVIQVFSSPNQDQAEKVRARLIQGGLRASISPIDTDGQVSHRVRVGPFSSRDEAETVATRVREEYRLDTWVTDASN